MKIEFILNETGKNSKTVEGVGRATTVIDGNIEDIMALELAKLTRKRRKERVDFGGLECNVVKLNNHSELYRIVVDISVPGLAPREFLTKMVWKMVWKKMDENNIILVYEDAKDDSFPIGNKYVRASATSFWKFEKLPDIEGIPQTSVTYY